MTSGDRERRSSAGRRSPSGCRDHIIAAAAERLRSTRPIRPWPRHSTPPPFRSRSRSGAPYTPLPPAIVGGLSVRDATPGINGRGRVGRAGREGAAPARAPDVPRGV